MNNSCGKKRKGGRPPKAKEDRLDRRFEMLLGRSECDILDTLADETGMNRAKIIREAIKFYYDHRAE